MNARHGFSLSSTANKVGLLVAAVMAGFGFLVATSSFAYPLIAIVFGVCFGIADLLQFLQKKWPSVIAIFVVVIAANKLCNLFYPTLGRAATALVVFQFLGIKTLAAMTVVAIAERIERRRRMAILSDQQRGYQPSEPSRR